MPFDERMLNGMGVLTAIVDCGSFAAAGEALDMSQSGVSRSVARLETRLGIRLFDRTTRSVVLTDEGRRFYEQIVPLLGGLEEAAATAAQGATAVRGRLRVSISIVFASRAGAEARRLYRQASRSATRVDHARPVRRYGC